MIVAPKGEQNSAYGLLSLYLCLCVRVDRLAAARDLAVGCLGRSPFLPVIAGSSLVIVIQQPSEAVPNELNKYIWEHSEVADAGLVRDLAVTFDMPAAAARFLATRLSSVDSAREFLYPVEKAPHDPKLFDNMSEAVDCVRRAVSESKRILVHGDYDVDGISGTALLFHCFDGVVPHVFRFVPDRRKDGYGIAERAVDWAITNRVGLFVAVDCGTSDGPLVERMEKAGIDVVVCDHHEFPMDGNARGIMLNPGREGESYPFEGLCGTGVAYKFAQALEAEGLIGDTRTDDLLDLVALATVADLSPLVDENRRFVQEGLAKMAANRRIGIDALALVARINRPDISTFHIGFLLAPRLNAPGRISNAKPALELLCTENKRLASELAATLDADNKQRKQLTEKVQTDVMEMIENMEDRGKRSGFLLSSSDWNEGVLGIAASRVVDEYGKPAILVTFEGGIGKGSGRSVPGVNLKEVLDQCGEHLVRYGGHAAAIGLTIDPSNIDAFSRDLTVQLDGAARELPEKPRLPIDSRIDIVECSMDLVDFLGRCEPFGIGNKSPVWMIEEAVITPETRYVGKGHLKVFMRCRHGNETEGISFNWKRRGVSPEKLHGMVVDLAVSIKKGFYLKRYYPEIQVLDMREHEG